MNPNLSVTHWLILLALSLLWGSSFFFVGVAVEFLPPLTIVAARLVLGAMALNLALFATGGRMPTAPRVWLAFAAMGLLNNLIPFTLIVWGQTHIASGLASILNAATPVFAVVVAHGFTRDERLSLNRAAGVGLGFAGVVLVIGPNALAGLGVHVLAQLAILGAALSYSLAGVFGRRFARWGVSPLTSATGQVSLSALVMLPLALAIDHPWMLPPPPIGVWAALVALALGSTALAYVLYFHILAQAGATNILLVTFLVPVSAIALGALFLGEQLSLHHFAGIAVLGLGLAAIDGRLLRRLSAFRAARLARSEA